MKNKFNIWDYLYYRATLYYNKTETKLGFEDNKRRGSYTVGLLISLNVESLIMLIILLFLNRTPFLLDYMGYLIVCVFLIIIFYTIYLFEKKRHIQIFNRYKNESNIERKKRNIFLGAYITFTIILFFLAVSLGRTLWVW